MRDASAWPGPEEPAWISTGWPCGERGTFRPPSTVKYFPWNDGTRRLPGRTKTPAFLSAMKASSAQLSVPQDAAGLDELLGHGIALGMRRMLAAKHGGRLG